MAIEVQKGAEGRREKVAFLIEHLLTEMPAYREEAEHVPDVEQAQRDFLRALMNVRPPLPLRADFLREQDALLREESEARGIVDGRRLPTVAAERGAKAAVGVKGGDADGFDESFVLWQGDITRLAVDAIVNAANAVLLGCFVPLHRCIDNAIHSAAGLSMRAACDEIMRAQGHEEPAGRAKITPGFNLPARYVLHTVGPIIAPAGSRVETPGVFAGVTREAAQCLASCYCACLDLAAAHDLTSVAFCCISTGEFHYPPHEAAETAVKTCRAWLQANDVPMRIIFNVFKAEDLAIYRRAFHL